MKYKVLVNLMLTLALTGCGERVFRDYLQQGQERYEAGDYISAYEKWYVLAEQGNAQSQMSLAFMYLDGVGVKQNPKTALNWLEKASAQGDARAQYELGALHYRAMKQKLDYLEADLLDFFYDGMEDSASVFDTIELHTKKFSIPHDAKKAFDCFYASANQGFELAQFMVGVMYSNGWGVEKNDAEATQWYQRAADKGNDNARVNLGMLYHQARGVEQNNEMAFGLFRLAAKKNLLARYQLGQFYENGFFVEKNIEQALAWYLSAAKSGYVAAQRQLGDYYYFGSPRAPQYDTAFSWYIRAAYQKDFISGMLIKDFVTDNVITKENLDMYSNYLDWLRHGLDELKLAAERGDPEAQFDLGDAYHGHNYFYSQFLDRNDEEALKWYRLAAEKKDWWGVKHAQSMVDALMTKEKRDDIKRMLDAL